MGNSHSNGVSILEKLLSVSQEDPEFTLEHVFMELGTILVGVSTASEFILPVKIAWLGFENRNLSARRKKGKK